jgi:hypothetical protein
VPQARPMPRKEAVPTDPRGSAYVRSRPPRSRGLDSNLRSIPEEGFGAALLE